MPFGIPTEDFRGGFGIQSTNHRIENMEDKLTQLLIKAGITWYPRNIARFLIDNGVTVVRQDELNMTKKSK